MRTPGGKLACFGRGNTCRLRNECPIYLANVKSYNITKPACKKVFGGKKEWREGKEIAEVRFAWLATDNPEILQVSKR